LVGDTRSFKQIEHLRRRRWVRGLIDYLGISLGSLVTAVSLVSFQVPNKIAAGGVSGIAVIAHHLFSLPVGIIMLALNIPLFLLSLRELGLGFGLRTLYGTLTLSLFVDVMTPRVPVLTQDLLLATIYGGVLAGIGLGLCFRFKGSTGGTDLAARLINKYLKISLGQALLGIDFLVIAGAGILFNAELAMYALLSLFVTSQVIDLVQEGVSHAKGAFIISQHPAEITRAIFRELDRGATALKGRGQFTGRDQEVIFCVVSRAEETRLKDVIYQVDPKAFVIVTNVHEVLGEGFKRRRFF
jgi:uncharacterized membrane-anchored protein YitT (DUF2179 family)